MCHDARAQAFFNLFNQPINQSTCPTVAGTGHPLQPGPLIMYVHGGPNYRDYWGYSRTVQLLANRGYGVLQCNYRGSTGYGKEFINIANGEWGRKMQHDIIDAANWAVTQGIADPSRVAIYGGSYGGYSALAGITFTPDFFKCSVDFVGPSNLITMMETIPPYWESFKKSEIKRIGGDPSTEEGREFLKSRSPLFFADKIKKPLLIAQGTNDPRVIQAESDQIFEAMKVRKIPVTYLLFPDEGHGFVKPENNIAFVTKVEEFLADCLGGRAEPKGSDSDGTSMKIVHEGPFE